MSSEAGQKDTCPDCGKDDLTPIASGKVRTHGPKESRCAGSGKDPAEPGHDLMMDVAARGTNFGTRPDDGSWVLYQADEYAQSQTEDPFADDPFAAPSPSPAADAARARIAAGPGPGPNPFRAPLGTGDGRTLLQAQQIENRRTAGAAGEFARLTAPAEDPDLAADLAAFMGGSSSPQTYDEDELYAFMEQSTGPQWFPARWDGDCSGCGSDFREDEEIARSEENGGYIARECCDPGRIPDPGAVKRPRRTAPKVPLANGRYAMPHPQDSRRKFLGTRVTAFVKLASDTYNLGLWELRAAVVGMSRRPDLVEAAQGLELDPSTRVKLNALAEQAKKAAGTSEKSGKGTILHKFTEQVDGGEITLGEVPEVHRRDISAYREAMDAAGITILPHLRERTTAIADMALIGTFDRVFRLADGTYAVGDVKTGSLEYAQAEIATQLWVYAHGANETGIAQWSGTGLPSAWESWTWEPLRDEHGNRITVREDVAVVMHVPQGTGICTLLEVDLTLGRKGALLCDEIRSWQRVKSTMSPLAVPDPLTRVVHQPQTAGARAAALAAPIGQVAKASAQEQARSEEARLSAPWTPEMAEEKGQEAVSAGLHFKRVGDSPFPPQQLPGSPVRDGAGQTFAEAQATLSYVSGPPKTWQERFASVCTVQMARELMAQARAAGMPAERLSALVEVGKRALAEQPPF